ncbi:hypothetical protein VTK73DRAFT_4434 [Phialemonium thermophilum]|uniref:Uncharacterized protein n=1 Tax=Phialemonium thermophilum TaxID=223376 RepID=A0ABR3V8Z5_9PEZI
MATTPIPKQQQKKSLPSSLKKRHKLPNMSDSDVSMTSPLSPPASPSSSTSLGLHVLVGDKPRDPRS